MQQPSFIIQQTALSYQYFPQWTCLFLEKKYLNTQEKAQQCREEAHRNTNLNIKQNAKPRDIIYQIIEAQRLPTDGEQRFTLVNTGKELTIKRSSHKMTNTNSYLDLTKRFRTETQKRILLQPRKKTTRRKGLIQSFKNIFQKNAYILKRKYATRMVLLVSILTMMGIGVYKINELQEEKSRLVNTANSRIKDLLTMVRDLKIISSDYKKVGDYAFGVGHAEFLSTRTDNGIQVWIQKQHSGNCAIHSLNNVLFKCHIQRPISIIEWVRDSAAELTNEHYLKGGYSPIAIGQFLTTRNISFIFYTTAQCDKECFIEHYNSANCGVLFFTNTHAMCVRKNRSDTRHTFMDSNFTGEGEPVTLVDATAVYAFIIQKGWGKTAAVYAFIKKKNARGRYFTDGVEGYYFI